MRNWDDQEEGRGAVAALAAAEAGARGASGSSAKEIKSCVEKDFQAAVAVCHHLGMPLYEADFVARYWNEVCTTSHGR